MKQFLAISTSVLLSVVALGAMQRKAEKTSGAGPKSADNPSPIVVELFTSEGCSSCPPADALLLKLMETQRPEQGSVVALEEHVDYWDQLGWRDPFSSHEWTWRQENYAATLGKGNVYTPQMVVDGRVEFVGSREREAKRVIEEQARKPKASVSVTPADSSDGKERFSVHVGKLTDSRADDTPEVWLAITETGLHSEVTRGENAGEDLHHSAVVRTLRKIGFANAKDSEISFAGEATLAFNRDWKRDNLRAVVFVQEKNSREIVGAAETKVTP
jgi:hypothetical protein